MRVLSLGAGVQSSTVLLMSLEGELPPLDAAIFSDTGWEPAEVYRHLRRLADRCAAAGLPLHIVSAGNIRDDALDPHHRFASMPLFVRRQDGGRGMLRRQCTREYKIAPITKQIRALLGVPPGRRVPAGTRVERVIGISYDEVHRMRTSTEPWAENVYPLVDAQMTRDDCQRWLADHGWAAPRSSCVGCPLHSDDHWRHLKTQPQEWADAVAFDHAIRNDRPSDGRRAALFGQAYLHSSLVPLDEVDLRAEDHRPDLFGEDCQGMCGV